MMTFAVLHLVAAALRRRSQPSARTPHRPDPSRAERGLHVAADHADLKRLIEAQSRGTGTPWWPGAMH